MMSTETTTKNGHFRYVVLGLVVALISTACGGATPPSADTTVAMATTTSPADGAEEGAEDAVIRVGAAISSSGELFVSGDRIKKGYEIWADTVNDRGGIDVGGVPHSIELILLDDESQANTAATLAQRLISEDQVDFMFGPYASGMTQAVGAITEANDMIMFQPGGNADSLYEQGWTKMFGIIPAASTIPGMWLDAMMDLDPQLGTLGMLVKDDLFPLSQREGLRADAEALGVEIVMDEVFPPQTQDFSALISGLRSAEPDLLAVLAHEEDDIRALRQMREQLYYPKGGVFFSGSVLEDLLKAVGEEAEFVFAKTFWLRTMDVEGPIFGTAEDFAQLYEETYGEEPNYLNAIGAVCGVLLQLAIEQTGTLDREAVREALLNTEFNTFYGPVRYAENGQNVGGVVVMQQVIDGKPELVFPTEITDVEPLYPVPGWDDR